MRVGMNKVYPRIRLKVDKTEHGVEDIMAREVEVKQRLDVDEA